MRTVDGLAGARAGFGAGPPAQRGGSNGWRHALGLLALLLLSACGGGDNPAPAASAASAPAAASGSFVVNPAFAASLEAKGIPKDAAAFFASARLEPTGEESNTWRVRQTLPNGATRDIEMKWVLDQTVPPTAQETAAAARIFSAQYASSTLDGVVENRFQYFVPYSEMSTELRAVIGRPIGLSVKERPQAEGGGAGANVYLVETVKTGADVGIGSLIDYFKDKGIPGAGNLGNLYSLMSALSNIAGAANIGLESNNSQAELDALEFCALNPTDPLSKSDPNYSADTARRVGGAKSELAQVNAVRILNIMTETSIGLDPKLAALGILLKSGFAWNEQTLSKYVDNTILREARLSVVPCSHPFTAVFTFSYANAYDKCDDICHHYDEGLTASVTAVLRPSGLGGYINDAPSSATIDLKDSDTLTDSRALNPPYHVSHLLQVSATPTVQADGAPMPPPEGVVIKDYAELLRGKKRIELKAFAAVPAQYVTTDVGFVNGVVTQATRSNPIEQHLAVTCRFDNVDPSIGGERVGSVVEIGPYASQAQIAKGICKMTLTPIKPG